MSPSPINLPGLCNTAFLTLNLPVHRRFPEHSLHCLSAAVVVAATLPSFFSPKLALPFAAQLNLSNRKFDPDTSPEREFILRDKPHYIVMLNGVEGMGSWYIRRCCFCLLIIPAPWTHLEDHFSRIFQLYTIPHAPYGNDLLGTHAYWMLIAWCLPSVPE